MERVIAYIDGYNLYYSLRSKGWQRYYWLNIRGLVQSLLKPTQSLEAVKYFTTIIKQPEDRRRRQLTYLEALQTLPDFYFYYGQFLSETIICRQCGHTYVTYHEKMTDVNISVELMRDAFESKFDTALLISADSDLVSPIETVRKIFNKRVISVFPPGRTSYALKQISTGVLHIGHIELAKSVFPDQVNKNGVILQRPSKWK